MIPLKKVLLYLLVSSATAMTVQAAQNPEIDITGNSQSIPDGDISPSTTDDTEFGNVNVGSSVDHVFTIVNTGTKNLSLSGVPSLVNFEGGGSSDFAVTVQPSSSQVARNGGTQTFTVRFTPTGSGLKTARITIANSDADENPYDFSIQGTAVAASLNPPTVTSPPTTASIQDTTATLGGEVTDTGGANITERGIYWSTSNGFADGAGTKVSSTGSWGTGFFTENVSSLPESTIVYFKSFALNSEGPTYSSQLDLQTEPATQASVITFSSIGTTTMTVSWGGNGSGDGVIVVVNEAAAVDANPSDGTEHAANSAYALGANLGTLNYVVYRGTGSSVDLTNLDPFTTYHVAVYAYAGAGSGLSGINYQQDAPATGSQTSLQETSSPTVANPTQTAIQATTATLGGEVTATNNASITERGIYWSTIDGFTPPGQGAKVSSTGSWGTGTFSENITGLPESDIIYYRGFAINSAGTNYTIQATFQTEPTTPASGVSFSSVGANQMQVNWSGSGSGDGVVVVIKQDTAVDVNPTDGTEHAANPGYAAGANLGSANYVLFRASGTNVVVTGLLTDTTYHVAVYAYAGIGTGIAGINYQQDLPARNSQNTLLVTAPPTVANPTQAAIQDTTATLGGEVTSINNATVTERGIYWSTVNGFADGAGTKVSSTGSFGIGTFTEAVSGLPEKDIIYYKAFAVNSEGTNYTTQVAFQTEPTTQVSGLTITDVNAYGMTVNWSGSGSGDGVIVVMKKDVAVNADPTDGTEHNANNQFGNGAQLGTGNYVVYRASGSSVVVTNLASEATYHVAAYAYAGSGSGLAGINYQQDASVTGFDITLTAPVSGTPPSIENTTPSAIEATTATLGGNVTSVNGANVTERGIYWSTTDGFTPPGQGTKVFSTGDWGTGTFTENVTGLNQGGLIYYKAFAVNSEGTTYSDQVAFQVEPSGQVSAPNFSVINDTSATLTWSAGSGDGVLVVLKLDATPTKSPTDGTEHPADPGYNIGGNSIGGGNYVVYRSTGSSITITNLWPNNTYYVSLFEYSGAGTGLSGINYQQDFPPSTSCKTLIGQTWMGHNDKYGLSDCLICHGAGHSGPFIPRDTEQLSTTCGQCHNPTGVASNKCDVALHVDSSSTILADCGSCHEVHGGNDLSEMITDAGIHGGVGTNLSYFRVDTTRIPQAIGPGIYHDALDYAFDSAPYDGACQVCHTNTSRYRNFDLEYTGHAAPGSDCQSCHAHEDNWQGAGGTDCTVCHVSTKGSHRAVMPDFGLVAGHIPGGNVTTNDCITCHHEAYGNAYHGNNTTDLRNVDDDSVVSIAQPFVRNTASKTLEADVINLQDNFCLKCHDANGANGDTTPFSTGNPVPNVHDALDPGNSYFHPVRGPGNNANCDSLSMQAPWNQTASTGPLGDGHDVISCFDCHGINAHGDAKNDMLRVDISGTTDGANIRAFCTACHLFETGFGPHSQGAHQYEGSNPYECRGCHAGLVDDNGQPVSNLAASPTLEIHGGNFVWPGDANLGAGTTTQHFMNGAWLSGWSPNTCSVISPCKNHGSSKGY